MLFSKKNLSPQRIQELNSFCRDNEIKFNNLNLLDLAFHHRSYSSENSTQTTKNNERLEFLGDSVLGMATAAFLYEELEKSEGELAKIKSTVVSEEILAPISIKLGIDKMLILGKGEEMTGGRKKKTILADAVEAVIGALYLDSGYKNAEKFVLSFIIDEIKKVQDNKSVKDYKTLLQEFHQKKYKTCPTYEIVKETGPDHNRTFWANVHLKNMTYGPIAGKNKKEAEQNAAKAAFEELSVSSNQK